MMESGVGCLRGPLHCDTRGSRMLLDFATNPRGTTYAYAVSSGRAAKKTSCTRRSVRVHAERLVEESCANITISEPDYRHLVAEVDAEFDKRGGGGIRSSPTSPTNRTRYEAESVKLLAANFADAIDLAKPKRHEDCRGRTPAGRCVARRVAAADRCTSRLRALGRWQHAAGEPSVLPRLEITEDEQLRPCLAEPFATIVHEAA